MNITNQLLEYGLLVVATYLLFTGGNPWIVIPIFFVFVGIKLIHRYDKGKINDSFYTWGLSFMYLNILGEFFLRFYYTVGIYDKILHLLVPIYLVFLFQIFIGKKVRFRYLYIILAVIAIGLAWELFEYTVDSLSGTTIMRGVVIDLKELSGGAEDTLIDIIMNTIGTLCGAIYLKFVRKNKENLY